MKCNASPTTSSGVERCPKAVDPNAARVASEFTALLIAPLLRSALGGGEYGQIAVEAASRSLARGQAFSDLDALFARAISAGAR